MVRGISTLEYEDRLRRLNLFSLKYRRLRGDLIETYKFVNGQDIGYLKGLFEFSRQIRGRDHQHKLIIKQSRTRLRQSFFSRRVVGHLNKLPESVTSAASLASFKKRLDEYYMESGLVHKYNWDWTWHVKLL